MKFFPSLKRLLIQQCKGRSSLIKLIVNFTAVALFGLFVITQLYKHSTSDGIFERKTELMFERKPIVLSLVNEFHYVEPANSFFKQKHNVLQTKVDWHNYTLINLEKQRKGPGEHGKAFKLNKKADIIKNNKLNAVNGYYAVASDIISVNRSVADIRHPL